MKRNLPFSVFILLTLILGTLASYKQIANIKTFSAPTVLDIVKVKKSKVVSVNFIGPFKQPEIHASEFIQLPLILFSSDIHNKTKLSLDPLYLANPPPVLS